MMGPSGSQFSVTSSSPQLVLCLIVLACAGNQFNVSAAKA